MPIIIEDENGVEIDVPTRLESCWACDGSGGRALGGASFTGSEWAEACGDDPDFARDYMSGAYDTRCDDCNGSGRVEEPDYSRMSPALRAEVEAWFEAEARHAAEVAAERRAGC